jgi:uncharacterized protein
MRLDLSRIRGARERYEKSFAPEAFTSAFTGESDLFRVVTPVGLSFDVFKDKAEFQLVGVVQSALEQPCSRCLEPFVTPVEAHFDLRYRPHATQREAHDRQIEEDDLTTAYYENDEIDLGQLMREQFYLTLPMKPLCRDQCRGLCPGCGINRNRDECTCAIGWEDPRLAVLKTLRKDS